MGSSFALENTHFVERKEIIDENDQNHRNNYSYDLKFTSGGEFTFTINEDDRIRREGGGTLKNLVMVILTGKASAEEDDGSCTYESKLIFWQNQNSAASAYAAGVLSWSFYVDGQFIGSCATTAYYSSSPDCSSNGLASVTKSLGSSKTKSFNYSVKDQDGSEWYTGSVTLDGSGCVKKQIIF